MFRAAQGIEMNNAKRILMAGLIAGVITIALQSDAKAQYAVTVQPVVPAVVGYTAERRGFFGQRVVLRPVVANVPAAPAVAVERTVTVARPAVEPVAAYYPPPTVTVARIPRLRPVAAYHAPPGSASVRLLRTNSSASVSVLRTASGTRRNDLSCACRHNLPHPRRDDLPHRLLVVDAYLSSPPRKPPIF